MNLNYLNYKQPKIIKKYIPIQPTTRTGLIREETRIFTTHHTGVIDVPAENFYIASVRKGQRDTLLIDKYGEYDAYTKQGVFKSSYHIVIDYDGTIYIVIPLNEIAYASGAHEYSRFGKEYLDSQAWKYDIAKEICVSEPDYHINIRQEEVNADIDSDLCIEYGLDPASKCLTYHHAIALDKFECPKHYLKGLNWERHISVVKKMYKMKLAGDLPRLDLY